MPAVVSRCLSPSFSLLTQQLQQRLSQENLHSLTPSLSQVSSDTFPFFPPVSVSLWFSSCFLVATREQRTRGVQSRHRLLPQMLRGEWCAWMRECWAAASLPPSLRPPSFPQQPTQSPAQLEGQSPPTPPTTLLEIVIGFLACLSALGLTSPSLSVNTFSLWLAPSPHRHTPASAWFGREKAF